MDRFHCFLIAKQNDHQNTFLMKYSMLSLSISSILSSSVRHNLWRYLRSLSENVKVDENYILFVLNSVGTIYLRYCIINILVFCIWPYWLTGMREFCVHMRTNKNGCEMYRFQRRRSTWNPQNTWQNAFRATFSVDWCITPQMITWQGMSEEQTIHQNQVAK